RLPEPQGSPRRIRRCRNRAVPPSRAADAAHHHREQGGSVTETTTDEVKQTLAEYERLAISTGATVQIDAPEFSENGIDWSPVWGAGEGHVLPSFARVTVHRDGIPT